MIEPKCRHVFGCHSCDIDRAADYLWKLRSDLAALVQMNQVDQTKIREKAHEVIRKIEVQIIGE